MALEWFQKNKIKISEMATKVRWRPTSGYQG